MANKAFIGGSVIGLLAGGLARGPIEKLVDQHFSNNPIYVLTERRGQPVLLDKRTGATADIKQSGETMLLGDPIDVIHAIGKYCVVEDDFLEMHYESVATAASDLSAELSREYFAKTDVLSGCYGSGKGEDAYGLRVVYSREGDKAVPYLAAGNKRRRILQGMKTEDSAFDKAVDGLKELSRDLAGKAGRLWQKDQGDE